MSEVMSNTEMAMRLKNVEAQAKENSEALARIENILVVMEANSADVASVATNVREMVTLLGIIQEEVGPVIASLQDHPMLKMILGGKK